MFDASICSGYSCSGTSGMISCCVGSVAGVWTNVPGMALGVMSLSCPLNCCGHPVLPLLFRIGLLPAELESAPVAQPVDNSTRNVSVGRGMSDVDNRKSLQGMKEVLQNSTQTANSTPRPMTDDVYGTIARTRNKNREAAVGMGYPSMISMPDDTPNGTTADVSNDSTQQPTATRAISPASDTENSEVTQNPRAFLAQRNLGTTRSGRTDSTSPEKTPTETQRQFPSSATHMGGVEQSPVSPISHRGRAESVADRFIKKERFGNTSQPVSPVSMSGEFGRSSDSPIMGHAQRALGEKDPTSDAATATPRRESLRKLAGGRNGSMVSLVDDETHKIRPKKPLNGSSSNAAEDFDSLLQGGETLKLTLSPSSVRAAPVSMMTRVINRQC